MHGHGTPRNTRSSVQVAACASGINGQSAKVEPMAECTVPTVRYMPASCLQHSKGEIVSTDDFIGVNAKSAMVKRPEASSLVAVKTTGPGKEAAATSSAAELLDNMLAQSYMRSCLSACVYKGHLTREQLSRLSVVAQVEAKFIVAVLDRELLVLVDQHAAGERVELEQIQKTILMGHAPDSVISGSSAPDAVLEAVAVDGGGASLLVTTEEARWLKKHRSYAERWGFRYIMSEAETADAVHQLSLAIREPRVMVTHVPEVVGTRLLPNDLKAFIAEAEQLGGGSQRTDSSVPRVVLHIIAFKACRRAVKFGDPLSMSQMNRLLRGLALCSFPFQCAHGRPTLYPLLNLTMWQKLAGQGTGHSRRRKKPPLFGYLSSMLAPSEASSSEI